MAFWKFNREDFPVCDGWRSVFCPSKVSWCLTISRETGKDSWQISSGQGGVPSRVNTHKMPSEVDEKYFSNLERERYFKKKFYFTKIAMTDCLHFDSKVQTFIFDKLGGRSFLRLQINKLTFNWWFIQMDL